MKTVPSMNLLIDSHHGVYIPQLFAQHCAHEWIGISPDNLGIMIHGPDHEYYFEAWDMVLNNARHKSLPWLTLYQDGDLWAIDYDRMSDDEKMNFFGEI